MTQTNMVQKKINTAELQNVIASIPGHRFVTITTETECRMNKTGNPYFGKVTKRTTANVSIGGDYQNTVNNRRAKEGNDADFVASERSWGQKIDNKFVCKVEKNGDVKQYVALGYKSEPSSVEYFLNTTGEVISKETIKDFFVAKKSSAEHQGLSDENEVIYRNVKLGNIKELKYEGYHYIVVNH